MVPDDSKHSFSRINNEKNNVWSNKQTSDAINKVEIEALKDKIKGMESDVDDNRKRLYMLLKNRGS